LSHLPLFNDGCGDRMTTTMRPVTADAGAELVNAGLAGIESLSGAGGRPLDP